MSTFLLVGCSIFGSTSDTNEVQEPQASNGEAPHILISVREGSFVAFTGRKGELTYDGSFGDFQLQLAINPNSPNDFTQSVAGFAIPIHTLTTDDEEFTSLLLSDEYFHADAFPMATFFSTSIEHIEDDSFVVTGDLNVHGITKTISFPADITDEYVMMHIVISRNDFALGDPDAFDDEVPLDAKLLFR